MADHNWRRRFFWAGWIGAAGLLLVAAALWVYASNLRNQLSDVELRLVDAVMKMEVAQEDTASIQSELLSLRKNLALLTAADVVELALAGQAGAPEASGRAFVSRSSGLLFTASRLPVSADDRTFQLWYLTSNGPVSAGVVQSEPGGSLVVVLPVPGDLATLTGFAVSKPGSPAPGESGAQYLMTSR